MFEISAKRSSIKSLKSISKKSQMSISSHESFFNNIVREDDFEEKNKVKSPKAYSPITEERQNINVKEKRLAFNNMQIQAVEYKVETETSKRSKDQSKQPATSTSHKYSP